ncbi:MAG: GIY-YIG nuclease family protein [Candidatus Scatosoma sp.]
MATSKKLEIVYHNGQPDGIRSIRRHLSTMTTYVVPRPLLSEAKKITGITRPGIYYLINENDDNKIAQIYIGQTRNGVFRLDDHNRSKDFWNKAIMFLADNKTFSLDIISGLEEFAIAKAHEANRYKIENSVKPKYEIDEYDLPSIEEIYEEIQFIMATQGYKMDNAKQSVNNSEIFHTSRNGILACGVYNGDRFQVLEGSQINLDKPANLNKYNRLRKTLQADNTIVFENGAYFLKTTLEFNTPSGAAEFVLGGATNGWVEWKNENGITLDKVYRK